jgi:hypothetical protein
MEIIPFTIASKNQITRSKLNKECDDLYKENYKSLKRLRKNTKGIKFSRPHGLVESTQ